MAQQDDKFAEGLADIYADLKPSLLSMAYRFKVANARVFVDAWMSKAYEIVDRFDKGELKAKVYKDPDNHDEMEYYDPEKHDRSMFETALKNYLKQCLRRDILREYDRLRKRREAQVEKNTIISATTSDFSASGFTNGGRLFKYDVITIEHIIGLIAYDVERAEEESSSDAVYRKFLHALLRFAEGLRDRAGPADWKNLIVVPNIDETDNKKFFSYDFRSEVEGGVRRELCKMILEEENPIIIQKLGVLTDKNKPAALQKRLSRYFFEKKKGFPDRLRTRVKNKTL